MKKKLTLSLLLLINIWGLQAQNLIVSGSCITSNSTLVLGADATNATYNGKPVYYNSALPINFQQNSISAMTYLYFALSSELGTAEDRWVISYDGQPYYYFISNSATAAVGQYLPFDTQISTADCGGPVTVSIPCPPALNTTFSSGGLNYVITSPTTVAVGDNTGASGTISIPASVTNGCFDYTVSSIGGSAFVTCSGLTSVTIPNSVTSIEQYAFMGCSGLTMVTIPGSVSSIGAYAFIGCSGLTSVTIGNSVTSIGSYAFYACSGLTSVTIPNSVIIIDAGAFIYCSGLTSVTIPSSVSSIGIRAFEGCSSLTSVVCETSTPLSINSNVFTGVNQGACSLTVPNASVSAYQAAAVWQDFAPITCVYLTGTTLTSNGLNYIITSPTTVAVGDNTGASGTISIPASVTTECGIYAVTSIDSYAFGDCSGLTSVTIPDSVISIGGSAFSDCSSLTAVIIPDSVTSIGAEAFARCTGLTLLTIGNSVTSIDEYTFDGCSSLTAVAIPNSVTSIGTEAFVYCSGLTSVTIGNAVTSIGVNAFLFCTGLTSVIIPNSVTSINNSAFGGCAGLTSITIGNSVTIIDDGAFSYCSSLTSVTIPNSVTTIGGTAFRLCSSLTSVTIPSSVTSIGPYAFKGCSSLTSVICAIEAPLSIDSSVFGGVYQSACSLRVPAASVPAYQAAAVWQDFAPITSGAINTTTITACDTYTWSNTGQTYTTSGAYIGTTTNSVTEVLYLNINTSTLQTTFSSGGLNYIITSPTTVAVGNNSGASGSISIPASVTNACFDYYTVTSIGDGAFDSCSSLTSVTIPNSVTSIGISTFAYCSGLTSVTIPDSVTSIGYDAFFACIVLTSVNIPNSVTSINNSAFGGCSSLTSVTIPDTVTSIGQYAFYGCSGLTSVTIGDSVTSIGNEAFAYCFGLTSVVCAIDAPLSIDSNVFFAVTQSACTLLVPSASVAAYQAAAVWQDFAPIICAPTVNTNTVTACGNYTWADNGQTYTTSGTYTGTTTNCVTEQLVLTIITPPAQPSLACYETASFNTSTCAWDVTGTQPAVPTLACFQTASFNTTSCSWDVTGTQPAMPTLACSATATFNTSTCVWDVTGTQAQLSIWTENFNSYNNGYLATDPTGSISGQGGWYIFNSAPSGANSFEIGADPVAANAPNKAVKLIAGNTATGNNVTRFAWTNNLANSAVVNGGAFGTMTIKYRCYIGGTSATSTNR